ncbi:MAG: signal peptidase II, partial [Candidatus Obscuribacterales bacterium]|nr:signal peptidase II [Candidatus Obscuribacterales bacterium]
TLATVLTMAIFSWSIKRQFEIPAPHVLESIGLGCITGGAIGNLIDRYTQGKVTDFLDFAFINFPVFNVADVLIDTGIALVIIAILITGKQVNVKKKTQEEQMPQATSNDVKTG